MSASCLACARADVAEINLLLRGTASFREIARRFGMGRRAIIGHAGHYAMTHPRPAQPRYGNGPKPPKTPAARRSPKKVYDRIDSRAPAPAVTIETRAIETREDVLREFNRQYVEAWALHEAAKHDRDVRTQDKALALLGAIVDKLAKALRVYDDAVVHIDASTKILNVLSALDDDELRRIAIGRSESANAVVVA